MDRPTLTDEERAEPAWLRAENAFLRSNATS